MYYFNYNFIFILLNYANYRLFYNFLCFKICEFILSKNIKYFHIIYFVSLNLNLL